MSEYTPRLYILVGPICGGKSTMQQDLKDKGVLPLPSITDRPRRYGEAWDAYQFVRKGDVDKLPSLEVMCRRTFTVQSGERYTYAFRTSVLIESLVYGGPDSYSAVIDGYGALELINFCQEYGVTYIVIEVTAPTLTLIKRARKRGDDISEVIRRLEDDEEGFDKLRNEHGMNLTVQTPDPEELTEAIERVNRSMKPFLKEY